MQKKVRPSLRVSEEEIDATRKKMAIPKIKQELQIALLNLPVDKPAREAEIKRLGDKFVQEVRAGANFEELSRQFSSSSSGGKVERFWVRPEQLDPMIAKILEGAKIGMITDPLRNNDGFTIIKVYNTRALAEQDAPALSVMLKEIVLKLKSDASAKEADMMIEIGKQVAKNPGTCEDKAVPGVNDLQEFDIEVNQIRETMSELPSAIRTIADNLTVGGISPPFASSEDKSNIAAANIDRDQVYQVLMGQKLQLEAQKYLRNLRRENFIEIR
jgi:peptidyl-prolyl cis-trans isomerase SurA